LPLYEAIRDYLEIGPRVQVLNDRLAVTGDLLGIIHDYIDQDKMHQITWIVIILISESFARHGIRCTDALWTQLLRWSLRLER
jgi:uncharacterized Rmd1/YagE family protein